MFHASQLVLKHVEGSSGTKKAFNNSSAFSSFIHKLMALPMIPVEHVPETFDLLRTEGLQKFPNINGLEVLLTNYYEKVCVYKRWIMRPFHYSLYV
jgi:hypothetical protein